MSTSTSSAMGDAPHLPKPAYRTDANSPSRSAKRHHPFISNDLDPFLRNLSPTTILEAFTTNPQAAPATESLGDDLLQNIRGASGSERTLGLRAAKTLKILRSLCRELDDWEWTGSFEPPFPPMADSKSAEVVQAFHGRSLPMRGEADPDVRNADKQEYWGSLPARQVLNYERRLEAIREEVDSLNIEELKDHVLNVHVHSRSRPTSIYNGPDLEFDPRPSQYKRLDEVTAVITATILHSLPYLSRLTQLLNSWSLRVGVLRMVPDLLTGLAELRSAISSAWTTIRSPRHGFAADPQGHLDVSRESFSAVRQALIHKVADVGRLLDDVLDVVEGRQETIPDAWIDEFERLEEQFGAWVVEAEQRIGEFECRAVRKSKESYISNTSDGFRSFAGFDGANDGTLLHARNDGSDGNGRPDGSNHEEPEQQDTREENLQFQVPILSPHSFQFDAGVKQEANTEPDRMEPTPPVRTLATVLKLQTSLHSNFQHAIFSQAEKCLRTTLRNETRASFNSAAEDGAGSNRPGFQMLNQESPRVKSGVSHQPDTYDRPSNEGGGHASSDNAVGNDVFRRTEPTSATAYPHATLLDSLPGPESNDKQHTFPQTSSFTKTADVFETRSPPITLEQNPEGRVSDSATLDIIAQLVSTTLSKPDQQGSYAEAGCIAMNECPSPCDNTRTYEPRMSNDTHQFTFDDTITPPTTESHISATPLGSPWECPTRLPSTDSRIEPDNSSLEEVKELYWDETQGAPQQNGQDTSWYYGSDSEAISPQPSLVVQSSSVASTSMDEDSDESDSSLESFQQLKSEPKRKDPPQWISTSPPKERYRHASCLTTLSEASTPGSGGYVSDLSSPEIRQASAAEYFVPVEINTPPPLTRSHSSRSPFYPAAVSATRRSNSVRTVNNADQTPSGKLRLSIPDASPRFSQGSLYELKERDQSNLLDARPGILKRASITSVESFSRCQVKSVEVKRNTSVSSAASTVLYRPSEDRRRISSSSPERLGREDLRMADSGSLQASPSSPSWPVLDNSPSLRHSEKGPGARPPAPVLNAVMHKRRALPQSEPVEAESVPSWPRREERCDDEREANGVKTAQNKLDRRVETILRAISNRIEITPATGYDPVKGPTLNADTPKNTPTLNGLKAHNSPAITISPASAKEANVRHRGEHSDIKFYYLKEPGKKDRLLVVRENNNIVVVRVGGGWEELGYHLRTHYGQRSVSQPNVEFQGLPHASATLADAKCSTPTNRPGTAFEGSQSAQSNHKPFAAPRLLTTDMSATPCSAATIAKRSSITPTSPADVLPGRSSRLSWSNNDEPSLAGPYAKKVDVSEEGEQWVQQMVEQARKVSAEKPRVVVGTKIEIADIGKAGAKRRFFIKSPKMTPGG